MNNLTAAYQTITGKNLFQKLGVIVIKKTSITGILILVSIVLVSLIDCSKEIETPTPSESRTFSKYGFSFTYSKDFRIWETGMLEEKANDNSGLVQALVENEEVKIFQVGWIKSLPYDLEEDYLEYFLKLIEKDEETVSFERGQLEETTKAGHKMLYQYYATVDTEGNRAYGIVGILYCDRSQKNFTLMTMNNTISARQDVLEDFQHYLDSFACH
ncbi:MAG: hypothetical protein ACETWC_02265 [Acidobacteriota bacterium]